MIFFHNYINACNGEVASVFGRLWPPLLEAISPRLTPSTMPLLRSPLPSVLAYEALRGSPLVPFLASSLICLLTPCHFGRRPIGHSSSTILAARRLFKAMADLHFARPLQLPSLYSSSCSLSPPSAAPARLPLLLHERLHGSRNADRSKRAGCRSGHLRHHYHHHYLLRLLRKKHTCTRLLRIL